MKQNQISINVKMAAADVCVRINLHTQKKFTLGLYRLEIVVFTPESLIILSTYQNVITVYNVTVTPSGF